MLRASWSRVTPRARAVSARIPDDERHAERLLVGIPLVGEPAVAVKIPVVADERDQRVLVDALRLQLVHQPAHRRIDLRDEPVVPNHVLLVALGRVEPPLEADPPFVRFIGEKRRQRAEVLLAAEPGRRNRDAVVRRRAPVLRQILLLRHVLGVRREVADAQQERLVLRTGPQEVDGVACILLGDVHAVAVGELNPMPSVVGAQEIEIGRPRRADVVLPDVAGPVPAGAQHPGIGSGERLGRQRLAETVDAVPGHGTGRSGERPGSPCRSMSRPAPV